MLLVESTFHLWQCITLEIREILPLLGIRFSSDIFMEVTSFSFLLGLGIRIIGIVDSDILRLISYIR